LGPKISIPNLPFQGLGSILPIGSLSAQGIPMFKLPGMPEVLSPNIQSPESMHQKIKSIIKDRVSFNNLEIHTAKRLLSAPLKFLLEEHGVASSKSGMMMNMILEENDVNTVLNYLEVPSKIKEIR
jgi:hypothetical protein